jgi:putative ABC transport system ATP-binding protein
MLRRLLGSSAPAPAAADLAPSRHLIDLRAVVKDYVTDAGPFRALRDIDLQVDRGEFLAVVGKSGSGKSTLMNMMTGIDRATHGDVWVGGTHLNHMSEGQTAVWRGRTVGVIFQFFQLLPTLTVVENVMLPMDFGGLWTPREREERAMALLEQVEMADQARKLPSATSGGQQQRVAIARALANDPPILVADEPTGNLDSATAEAVIRLFDGLVASGKTIVMVTHDREIASHARRTVHMVDGRLLDGTLPDDAGPEADGRAPDGVAAGAVVAPAAAVGAPPPAGIAAAVTDGPAQAGPQPARA